MLRRERFATREAARMRLFWYIECFYNTRRRHSGLGYLSPADYESTTCRRPFRLSDQVSSEAGQFQLHLPFRPKRIASRRGWPCW